MRAVSQIECSHSVTSFTVFAARNWQYRFARDVLPKLTDKICSARPIKYSEILELDRLIRDFELHPCSKRLFNAATFPRDVRRLYMLKASFRTRNSFFRH